MMDGTFIEELRDSLVEPVVLEVDGKQRLVAPPNWQEIKRTLPSVAGLTLGTLSGFVDYIKANVDKLELDACLVHVRDHATVNLIAKLEPEAQEFRRHLYAQATLAAVVGLQQFVFGQFMDAETFTIGLRTQFVDTPDRVTLLEFIGSIREGSTRDTLDDGVSQEVKTARGVVFVENSKLPSPVTLRPFRSFREIDQPASPFVFRAKNNDKGDKPLLALFECDGAQWKLEAVRRVADYLRAALHSPRVIA